MSTVRVNVRDTELLQTEYTSLATLVDNALADLTPLVYEAKVLLDQPSSCLSGPLPALRENATELRADRDDLAWRLDFIRSHDNIEPIPHTIYGYSPTTPNLWVQELHAEMDGSIRAQRELGHTFRTEPPSATSIGHFALDVGGLVPVVGNVADGVNAAWYAADEQYLDAALSSMAVIPGIGQAVTLSKGAIRAAARASGVTFDSLAAAKRWITEWLAKNSDEAAGYADDVIEEASSTARLTPSTAITTLESQLQRKFKHASDFGIAGNYNTANAAEFEAAIRRHIDSPSTDAILGTYRGDPVTHYVDPRTGLNVIADSSGNFVSGWELGSAQLNHVLDHGGLS